MIKYENIKCVFMIDYIALINNPKISVAQHNKSINVIYHIDKLKQKKCKIIAIDTERTFAKIEYPLMMKTLTKLGKQDFLNLIKTTYRKTYRECHIIL